MTRIYTPISIPLPMETVFNYVTTPGNWPQWHPSSRGVSGATDHSLEIGEQVTEKFLIGGRRGQVTWTVRDRVFPQRWVIEGTVAGAAGKGTITYTLRADEHGTLFEREFIYTMANPLLSLLGWLVVRRHMETESLQAVQQLKQVLIQQQASATSETP